MIDGFVQAMKSSSAKTARYSLSTVSRFALACLSKFPLIHLIEFRAIQQEILKVKGFQVAPAELEGHLLDHPDVNDVGVVGVPDEFSGELPLAFVVLQSTALKRIEKDPAESGKIKEALKQVCFSSLPLVVSRYSPFGADSPPTDQFVSDAKVRYKWLDGGVEFIDAIPKNPSGKILVR